MKKTTLLLLFTFLMFESYAYRYNICHRRTGYCMTVNTDSPNLCGAVSSGWSCNQVNRAINRNEERENQAKLKKLIMKIDSKTGDVSFLNGKEIVFKFSKSDSKITDEIKAQIK